MAIFSGPQKQKTMHYAGPVLAVSLIALAVSGCVSTGNDITASISTAAPRSDAEWRQNAEVTGENFRKNPNDPDAAIQ